MQTLAYCYRHAAVAWSVHPCGLLGTMVEQPGSHSPSTWLQSYKFQFGLCKNKQAALHARSAACCYSCSAVYLSVVHKREQALQQDSRP